MFTYTNKKSILREKYLLERTFFSKEEIEDHSDAILQNLKKKFPIENGDSVHIFLPIHKFNELNTFPIISYFLENGVEVYVPKIVNNSLISLKIDAKTKFFENSWGILEPKGGMNECSHFQYVITPLVYCDHNGNRVGYGKGFYDRFFKTINTDAIKIGVNLFSPNEEIEDIDAEDVALDYLVTPIVVLSFTNGALKSKK